MEQKSNDSTKETKLEENIQKLLEQNRINTKALRKLLKFIQGTQHSEEEAMEKGRDNHIEESKS